MPVTVVTPDETLAPVRTSAFLVYARKKWSDDWEWQPELEVQSVRIAIGGQDLDQCVLRRAYGQVMRTWQTDLSQQAPDDLMGWWVQVRLTIDDDDAGGDKRGETTIWTGRISDETRELHGEDTLVSGVQTWTAYGPLQELRKIGLYYSWYNDGGIYDNMVDTLPSINIRDKHERLVGNRSADDLRDDRIFSIFRRPFYVYGGHEKWTHKQYLQYLLGGYVNRPLDSDYETWRLGGQADLLDEITNVVPLTYGMSVADVMHLLIDPKYGLDFKVNYYEETYEDDDGEEQTRSGFEIEVFSLLAEEYTYATKTLAANANKVEIIAGEARELVRIDLERSHDQLHDIIVVTGQPITVCTTLWGGPGNLGTLHSKWDPDLELEYIAGTGDPSDTVESHDRARERDKYRQVYRIYGAPDVWDFYGGRAAPYVDSFGDVVSPPRSEEDLPIRIPRSTLLYLPLRAGYDYTVDPPTDNNPSDYEAEFLAPMVFALATGMGQYPIGVVPVKGYELIEKDPNFNASVSALTNEWGVELSIEPAHLMAADIWTLEELATTAQWPYFDYYSMNATIAFHGPYRAALEYKVPGRAGDQTAIDAGEVDISLLSVKVINVPEAEIWFLAKETIVGTDEEGELLLAPKDMILRNDLELLGLRMAGAIARYGQERARATLRSNVLLPWAELLGQILTVLDADGETRRINAVITSIEWMGGDRIGTVVKTGYAR